MFGRSRTRTVRRKGPRPASVAGAGLITLALIVGFIYISEESYNGLPFLSYRTVNVSLPNIGHLEQHDPVDIAGVRVGQVLSTSTKNNKALVKLQLQGVGPLPSDSKAIVRADGLLGERYVELDVGSSKTMLPQNGTIVETNYNKTYYNGLPDALNLFNAPTRTALQQMVGGLGEGLTGRGTELNQAIHAGPPSGANFDTGAYAILARPGAAARFLPNTNAGLGALNSAKGNLAGMLHPASVALQPLIDRRADVDRTLAEAPAFVNLVRTGLGGNGVKILASVKTLAATVDKTVPPVPNALRSTTALLHGAQGPLRKTKVALNAVPAAVPSALHILSALKPDLTPLKQGFTNLDAPVTSLSEHGCDIQNFSTGVQSLVSFGTLPGGNLGAGTVDGGFPADVIVQPGPFITNQFVKGQGFPTEDPYPAPCAYSPGPTINAATLTQVLGGALR